LAGDGKPWQPGAVTVASDRLVFKPQLMPVERWPETSSRNKTKGESPMVQAIIVWLIIGAVAGWLAGKIVEGTGFGLIVDIIVGIVGALIGGWLAGMLGIDIGGGLISSIIVAVVGAVILLLVLRLIKRVM
jgi:uncharacterized membrane protein YeaQ/YmgE (transglycosylase-associated protein family)